MGYGSGADKGEAWGRWRRALALLVVEESPGVGGGGPGVGAAGTEEVRLVFYMMKARVTTSLVFANLSTRGHY